MLNTHISTGQCWIQYWLFVMCMHSERAFYIHCRRTCLFCHSLRLSKERWALFYVIIYHRNTETFQVYRRLTHRKQTNTCFYFSFWSAHPNYKLCLVQLKSHVHLLWNACRCDNTNKFPGKRNKNYLFCADSTQIQLSICEQCWKLVSTIFISSAKQMPSCHGKCWWLSSFIFLSNRAKQNIHQKRKQNIHWISHEPNSHWT